MNFDEYLPDYANDDIQTSMAKTLARQKLKYLIDFQNETITWGRFDKHENWSQRKRELVERLCSCDIDAASNDELFALYDAICEENRKEKPVEIVRSKSKRKSK